ncbi:MAG: hypothetical protein ACREPB_07735 [Arenimonas sp.]
MKYNDLLDEYKKRSKLLQNDAFLAKRLGVTSARISQMRASKANLTTKQVVALSDKLSKQSVAQALRESILPITEHYPIDRADSKHGANWEILPTSQKLNPRNFKIRKLLEQHQGIYFFYDSQGKVLYNGKTEKQGLWKEINNAYNRVRDSHKVFRVKHLINGTDFLPAWQKPRQPVKRSVYFHEVASFFSAYKVAPELIPFIEALIVRSVCNDLSNVRMEKLHFPL